jgi:hypothetical protein
MPRHAIVRFTFLLHFKTHYFVFRHTAAYNDAPELAADTRRRFYFIFAEITPDR